MRILMFWTEHFSLQGAVTAARRELVALGHEVQVFRRRFDWRRDWRRPGRYGLALRPTRRGRLEAANRAARKAADKFRPDLVLSLVGDLAWLTPETLVHLGRAARGPVAAVLVDGLADRLMAAGFAESLPHYDPVLSFDPRDVPVLRGRYGRTAGPFSHFYDPEVFYPGEAAAQDAQDIDIFFAGSPFPERLRLLDRVAAYARGRGRRFVAVGGHNLSRNDRIWKKWRWWKESRFRRQHPELAPCMTGRQCPPGEIARYYRRSRICLNLHGNPTHAGGRQEGVNSRTYDILGAGGFLLSDHVPALDALFTAGEDLAVYADADDLAEKLDFYLENPDLRRRIALRGHQTAREKYAADRTVGGLVERLARREA